MQSLQSFGSCRKWILQQGTSLLPQSVWTICLSFQSLNRNLWGVLFPPTMPTQVGRRSYRLSKFPLKPCGTNIPLFFPKDVPKQSWDSSFHKLGTKSWADRNAGAGQMRMDPASPVPVAHAQCLGSLAQRLPQNVACWVLCSCDTLWMGRRSGEGNVWVEKGHRACSPNRNSGVRMWWPAGVSFSFCFLLCLRAPAWTWPEARYSPFHLNTRPC